VENIRARIASGDNVSSRPPPASASTLLGPKTTAAAAPPPEADSEAFIAWRVRPGGGAPSSSPIGAAFERNPLIRCASLTQEKHPCILSRFEEFTGKLKGKRLAIFLDYDGERWRRSFPHADATYRRACSHAPRSSALQAH
jgi:hypothetical protein